MKCFEFHDILAVQLAMLIVSPNWTPLRLIQLFKPPLLRSQVPRADSVRAATRCTCCLCVARDALAFQAKGIWESKASEHSWPGVSHLKMQLTSATNNVLSQRKHAGMCQKSALSHHHTIVFIVFTCFFWCFTSATDREVS